MFSRECFSCVCIGFACFFYVNTPAMCQTERLTSQEISDIHRRWEKLGEAIEKGFSANVTDTGNWNERENQKQINIFKIDGDWFLMTIGAHRHEGELIGQVWCRNSQYAFYLEPRDEEEWLISRLTALKQNQSISALDHDTSELRSQFLCTFLCLSPTGDLSITSFESNENFENISYTKSNSDDAELVFIKCQYRFDEQTTGDVSIVLSPKFGFMPTHCFVDFNDGEIVWEREYQNFESAGRFYIPQTIKSEIREKSGQSVFFCLRKIDAYEFAGIPEKEFRLTAFGLPEPKEFRKKRWHWWLIVGGIGFILLCVSVFFARKRAT